MDGARVSGAAMRRRERRLPSWAKHERMTVAMALAEDLHHSRQKVEGGEHVGPRAQKTARATGARPGVLTEPESQEGAVTVGYVAAPAPLLVVASLAGGDEVDATTVSYLLEGCARVEEGVGEGEEAAGAETGVAQGVLCAGGCACPAPLAPAGEQARSAC